MAYEVVLTQKQFVDFLKSLPFGYASQYNNKYPYNCLFNQGKAINGMTIYSSDCNNLVKSTIWSKATLPKNKGEFVYKKGQYGLGDVSCEQLIALCNNQSTNFTKIIPGECLWMQGHIGTFVGEWTGKWDGKTYTWNTIEATSCWGTDGILATYTDAQGRRFNHKGGTQAGTWKKHGKLPFIEYPSEKTTYKTVIDLSKYDKVELTLK